MSALSPEQWISLVASVGHLMLALLVIGRGGRNPLALPLALLCLDFFAWTFATLAHQVSGAATWHVLDMAFSPFSPPLALYLILVFVGRLRSMRWLLVAAFVAFGLLSIIALLGFLMPSAYEWSAAGPWGTLYLAGLLALMAFGFGLLIVHLRWAVRPSEKARARLILAALLVGGTLGSTVFWDDLLAVPDLGCLGSLSATALLTIVVLRFRLFGRDLSVSTALYTLALAALAAWGYLFVFGYFATNAATLVVGVTTVTVALGVALREVLVTAVVRRERRRQLEGLGRMAAQMAHDLKNPLSALKGAIEFLVEELAQGRSIDEQRAFLELMAHQVARIGAVIDEYQRLSRLEPARARVDLNQLVREVLSLQPFAGHDRVHIEATLAEELPPCRIDRDLVASALENLVENAFEAMPTGGTLRVVTASEGPGHREAGIVITVQDDGVGMDARQRERAFDSFFTTKPQGSGLGLAQVRRVIEAHDGDVSLASHVGQGTIVRLRLPPDTTPQTEAS